MNDDALALDAAIRQAHNAEALEARRLEEMARVLGPDPAPIVKRLPIYTERRPDDYTLPSTWVTTAWDVIWQAEEGVSVR